MRTTQYQSRASPRTKTEPKGIQQHETSVDYFHLLSHGNEGSSGMQTRDEALVPLTINCWPSASGGDSYVNIEYESTTSFDLQDVVIAIPLPALTSAPRVNQARPFQPHLYQVPRASELML